MRALLALLLLFSIPAFADDLDVDLSKPDVRLDVSFEGSDLLLFGAKDLEGDVIVVVRGPAKDTSVRFKERVAGVWVSTDEVIFAKAPAFYALATTRPVADLLPPIVLKAEKIGTEHLDLDITAKPTGADGAMLQKFYNGLLRNMVRKGLYTDKAGKIGQIGKQLFRTDLWFPANVSVGDYSIDTYMIADGHIETKKTMHLQVHKVGIEASIYNFAHEHALIYGLLAVVIAVVSGWAANAVFKKRG